MVNDILCKLEANIKEREQYNHYKTNWFLLILLFIITYGIYLIYDLLKQYKRIINYSKKQHEFFLLTADYLKYKTDSNMAVDLDNILTTHSSNIDNKNADINKSLRDFFALTFERLKCKIDDNILINFHNIVDKYYYMIYEHSVYDYKKAKFVLILNVISIISVYIYIPLVPVMFSLRFFINNPLSMEYWMTIGMVVPAVGLIYFLYYFYIILSRIRKSWGNIQAAENEIYLLINDALIKQDIIKEPLIYKPFNYNINLKPYLIIALFIIVKLLLIINYVIRLAGNL